VVVLEVGAAVAEALLAPQASEAALAVLLALLDSAVALDLVVAPLAVEEVVPRVVQNQAELRAQLVVSMMLVGLRVDAGEGLVQDSLSLLAEVEDHTPPRHNTGTSELGLASLITLSPPRTIAFAWLVLPSCCCCWAFSFGSSSRTPQILRRHKLVAWVASRPANMYCPTIATI
jgi:hypothetical protein